MATKEKTCAERIASEMKDREETLKALMEKAEENEYYGDEEGVYEFAIGITRHQVMTLTLSYGGPADYLEVHYDDDGIGRVVYRFSDWFDTATREVEKGSPLWTYAEMMLEVGGY